jgi:hypothetical protein
MYEITIRSSNKSTTKFTLSLEGARYRELIDRRGLAVSHHDCDRIMNDIFGSATVTAVIESADVKIQLADGKLITFKSFIDELKRTFNRILRIEGDERRRESDYNRPGVGTRLTYGTPIYSSDSRKEPLGQAIERTEKMAEPALKLQQTMIALNQTRPVAHCVARALQLLGAKTSNTEFESAICDTTFRLTSEGRDKDIDRSSTTIKDEPIGKSPGIRVLAQLFYDFVQIKSSQIIRTESQAAVNEYINFMRSMLKVYSTKTPEEIESEVKGYNPKRSPNEENEITTIKDDKTAAECKKIGRASYNIGTNTGRNVMAAVKKLFGAQIQHSAECGRILNMLFTMKNMGDSMNIRINPSLFIKGFPELDRINGLTRTLLVKYYTNCEAIYKTGMDYIVQEKVAEEEKEKQRKTQLEKLKEQQLKQQQQQQQQQPQQQQPVAGKAEASLSIQPPKVIGGKHRYTRKLRATSKSL